MQIIKFLLKHIAYFFLHILWIVPINKRKIYFTAFHGARFSCNPKYLYLYLVENYGGKFSYVWEFQDIRKAALVQNAQCVRFKSFKSLLAIMTSDFIVANNDFPWYIPFRKEQTFVQTWHGGGAYKKVGLNEKWNSVFEKEQVLIAKPISVYISSSRKFTEVQSPSKSVPLEKFIQTGMPRNAVFFDSEKMTALRKKVFDSFSLENGAKVILYAPTFRGQPLWKSAAAQRTYGTLDFALLRTSLEERFGESFVIFYRAHHVDSLLQNSLPPSVIDTTRHEDMQELLCAADVLITDYSSTMWDFALTKKPCFLYAPDLAQYVAERGFYTDPHTWPFPLAESEDELWRNIRVFDAERYALAVQKHLDEFGSYENADSCRKVCEAAGLVSGEKPQGGC